MATITDLSKHAQNAKLWDAERMLLDALEDVRSGKRAKKKALILWLEDDEDYAVGFTQCGMTMPECILLCEMGKERFKEEL